MNISETKLRIGAAAAAALGLAACGGGGGGSDRISQPPTSSNPPPATSAKVSASGVITGFGSVYVSGVRYDTSAAEIEFEDEGRMTEDALRLGMKVKIEGERDGDDRRADRIRYDDDLEGPVSAVQPDAGNAGLGTFTVAGQDITVDDNTVFDDSVGDNNGDASIDLLDLDPANGTIVVEVSGFQTDTGILATRVERDDDRQAGDDDEVKVKGYVTDLDEAAGTFRIRDLTVSWTPDDLDGEDFPDGTLSEDVFVEVEGTLRADATLEADSIEREDDFGRGDDDEGEFEIEGILEAVDTASSPNTITIDGQTIAVDDASRLAGRVGKRVEVEGTFDANGVLVLDDGDDGVKFERENSVRTEDRIETVGADSFFTRLGLEITPTGASRIEDDDADDGDRLTPEAFLARVSPGDYVEARGYPDSDGTVTWTRIERDDDEDDQDCELRGPVADGSVDDPFFVIQGVTIDTAQITSTGGFRDQNDVVIGRDEFFTRLAAGDVVEAESIDNGGCSDGLLIAEEVEFERDDGVAGNDDNGDDMGDDDGAGNDGAAADEVGGMVSNVDDVGNTFVVAGRSVTVTADTLIDASIVEAARGEELGDADLRFGDLPESLSELLPDGLQVTVRLDGASNAILIEDQD